MIRLEVEDYCQECAGFVPTANSGTVISSDGEEYTDTVVYCENYRKCRHIARQIKKELEQEQQKSEEI